MESFHDFNTEILNSQLLDFESWKTILERSEKNSDSVGSQGAVCVLPNSLEARRLDPKGNVYAFGILLLEIISGRPPYCKNKGTLVDWVRNFLKFKCDRTFCFQVVLFKRA